MIKKLYPTSYSKCIKDYAEKVLKIKEEMNFISK